MHVATAQLIGAYPSTTTPVFLNYVGVLGSGTRAAREGGAAGCVARYAAAPRAGRRSGAAQFVQYGIT